eukprot:1199254-Ditylum_brightwellii.AAC.1
MEALQGVFLAKREEKAKSMREEVSRLKLEDSRIKFEESNNSVKAVPKPESSLNVSYKVETREIPKLPPNKSLKGKLFGEWQATMGSNASSFINGKTMTGIEMYNCLLDVFQGLEHDEDAAVNATTTWGLLKFN